MGMVLQGRDVSSMVLIYGALEHAAVAHVEASTKTVVAIAVVVIATLPIWLPIVARVSIPLRWQQRMARSRAWGQDHERAMVIAVCVIFAAYLLARGAVGGSAA